MTSSRQLFLLADHLKLSLLERQRAVLLKLNSSKQDNQIEQSLKSLHSGIEELEGQHLDPGQPEDQNSEAARLWKQYNDLYAQYYGNAAPTRTTQQPNDPSLESDFVAAQKTPDRRKNVRFRDNPNEPDVEEAANRSALFAEQERYRDEPAAPDQTELSNQQIHQYHKQVIQDQDEQLDVLGASISRQRILGIQMGSELEEQNEMLRDVESGVDRHQSLLSRAQKRLTNVARKSKSSWSWVTIAILICILVLLLIVTK